MLLRVTNYSEQFGQEAEDEAKRAVNLKSEQSDDEWSEGEEHPLRDSAATDKG